MPKPQVLESGISSVGDGGSMVRCDQSERLAPLSIADCAGEAGTSSKVGVGSWGQESVQEHQPAPVHHTTVSADKPSQNLVLLMCSG